MKKLFIIAILGALLIYSCNPVYDTAPDIGNPPTAKIVIVDKPDPNHVVFDVQTDNGFVFTWDFGNGVTSTNKMDTAYYPFAKTYTVKVIVNGKGGTTIDSTQITIDQNDPAVAQQPGIKELTNEGKGRVWVFATDNCDPEGSFFYMTASYDYNEFWWDPVPSNCCNTANIAVDSIKFDLDGDYNYTHYCWDGRVEKGTFVYDDVNKTIKFINANLPYDSLNTGLLNPDAFTPGNTVTYQVIKLDDTQLWLWQNQAVSGDYSYGWMWVFKPAGTTMDCGK